MSSALQLQKSNRFQHYDTSKTSSSALKCHDSSPFCLYIVMCNNARRPRIQSLNLLAHSLYSIYISIKMAEKYYFDTSIWLDYFEDRDEPNFPKSTWARDLVKKIVKNSDKIVYSDNNMYELFLVGYDAKEIDILTKDFRPLLIFVESTEKQVRKARDLSLRRDVPKRDALHALIARDNKSIMVTFDGHFKKLKDITKPKRTNELI